MPFWVGALRYTPDFMGPGSPGAQAFTGAGVLVPGGPGTDDAQALAQALAGGARTVYLSPGTYTWNSTVLLPSDAVILGQGATITSTASTAFLAQGQATAPPLALSADPVLRSLPAPSAAPSRT